MTTTLEAPQVGSGPAPGEPASRRAAARTPAPHPSAPSRLRAVLVPFMVLLVLTQRAGVDVGGSPVPVALVLGGLVVLLLAPGGLLRLDRVRFELYAIGVLACLTTTVLVYALGDQASLPSFALLLASWAPFVLVVAPGHLGTLRRLGRAYVRLMVVLALVGVAQLLAQFAGAWVYADYVGDLLGPFAVGGYNNSIEIFYDAGVYKANAFVFLEPSFLSQYCALAVAVALVLRAPTWQIVALVAGVAASVSGTGILLLLVTFGLVLVRARHLLTVGLVLATLTATVLIALTPIAPLLQSRTDELGQEGTSGSLRFAQPWTEVVQGLEEDDQRYVIGSGAGAAQRELTFSFSDPVVYPVVPKLAYEYGILAGGLFTIFILISLLDGMPWRVVPGATVVLLFVLSGSLLQPQTILLAWLLTSAWAGQEVGSRGLLGSQRRSTAHRRGRAPVLRRSVSR